MAKVDVYEHSKFATFLSFLGWIGMAIGAYCCFTEEIGWKIGIVLLAISFVLKILAGLLNHFVGQMKSKWAARKKQKNNTGNGSMC